jgi:2-polyprenyl-6-methoxyphenol hydroxylase-like FAD-dependent oxidoreductase
VFAAGHAGDNVSRILIVGGGIAGLALRAALRDSGCRVDLIERNTRWAPVGGGLAVQPNAMRALASLGVGEAVEAAGTVVTSWVFADPGGGVLCEVDLASVWGDVGPLVGIARRELHAALLAGAMSPCRCGVTVGSLRDHGGEVAVVFSDGTSATYDVVVGADGVHSALRHDVFGGPAPVYGGQVVWRSLSAVGAGGARPVVQFWLGDGCFFGLCPAGDVCTYGFANVAGPCADDPVAGRLERLRRRFGGFGPSVQQHLNGLRNDREIHWAPIEWLPRDVWRRGRVVLIGDAAHACSPMMGQGGSMAIEDAVVLGGLLGEGGDIDKALDEFVGRRRARVEWVRQQSHAVGELIARPATTRDPALRAHGVEAFADRFRPLAAPPP